MTILLLTLSGSLAASLVFKATVIMMLGLGVVWVARRQRAALRHAVLAATFLALLLLPIAAAIAPPFRIAVSTASERTAVLPASQSIGAERIPPGPVRIPASTAWRPSLTALLVSTWIGGAVVFLLPVIIGLRRVCVLRRSAVPWRLDAAGVEILLHDRAPGPLNCGIARPGTIPPRDAKTWNEDDLKRALVHELEHVQRRDWLTLCMARAICAAYWFHPLVWIAFRRLAIETERACDDAVLASSDAAAYADQLVGLARRMASVRSPLLAMANRSDLAARVHAVLDQTQRRGRAGRLTVAMACAAAVALIFGEAPLSIIAAQQSVTAEQHRVGVPRFTANSMLVMVRVTVTDAGKPVAGLTARDFAITEDNADETIGIFEPRDGAYVLGYYTRNDRPDYRVRKIQVTCKNLPTARLDYRPLYYFQAGASSTAPGAAGESGVTRPVVLHKFEPAYSDEARNAMYQGTALLLVELDTKGRVGSVKVLNRLGLGLDEKAIEAVKQWRFKPAFRNGQPVTMDAEIEVHFRLL